MNQQKACFIVSTGRSGSQMMAKVFGLHPDTCALHEPFPLASLEAYLVWSKNNGRQKLSRNVSIENQIRKKRTGLITQIQDNGLMYIESSYFLGHLIPHLDRMFDARYIYIYRNGQDFVRSGLRRPWYTRTSWSDTLKRLIRRSLVVDIGNPHEDHRLIPPSYLRSRFEKITWLWTEMNQVIQDNLSTISADRQYVLSLEEFNQTHLSSLHEFMDLSIDTQRLDQMLSIAHTRPNRSEVNDETAHDVFSEERFSQFNSIAGDMMRRLGYDSEHT